MIGCDYRLGRRAESPNYCVIWADTPAAAADKHTVQQLSAHAPPLTLVCLFYLLSNHPRRDWRRSTQLQKLVSNKKFSGLCKLSVTAFR